MCANVVYAFLFGLASYILVTAIAFSTLPWWQATLVSVGFFVAELLLGRYLVKRALRRVTGLVQSALDPRGKVLGGSSLDVHKVAMPGGSLQAFGGQASASGRAYEVEFTLFPPDPAAEWEPDGLRFAPAGAPAATLLGGSAGEITPSAVRVVAGDESETASGSVTGARRLRATLDVPPGVKRLSLRYGLAEFGAIDLTKLTPTAGRDL